MNPRFWDTDSQPTLLKDAWWGNLRARSQDLTTPNKDDSGQCVSRVERATPELMISGSNPKPVRCRGSTKDYRPMPWKKKISWQIAVLEWIYQCYKKVMRTNQSCSKLRYKWAHTNLIITLKTQSSHQAPYPSHNMTMQRVRNERGWYYM